MSNAYSSLITIDLIVEKEKAHQNESKSLRILNLILNIVSFSFNHSIPPLNEGIGCLIVEKMF